MSTDESPNGSPEAPAAVQGAEWLPSLGGARLVRVRGVGAPSTAASDAAPVLVMTGGAGEQSVAALPESRFARGSEGWAASFLVPADADAGAGAHTSPESAWLQWPDGSRLSVPVASATIDPPATGATAEGLGPEGWHAHRAELEAELSRTASELAVAREDAEAAARRSAASARESEDLAAAAHERLQEATSAAAAAESRAAVEALARQALEAEMTRRAAVAARVGESLAAEREARLALGRSLSETRAELGAVRSARAADQSLLETMTAERDAERVAATVARGIATELRGRLAGAQAEAAQARARADALEGEAEAARSELTTVREERETLRERLERAEATAGPPALFPRPDLGPGPSGSLWSASEPRPEPSPPAAADPGLLHRLGLAQAAAAAAARGETPDESAGRMLSDLDAAAAALRRALPADAPATPPDTTEATVEESPAAAAAQSPEEHEEASTAIREALEAALAESGTATPPPGRGAVAASAAAPVGEDGATEPERPEAERAAVGEPASPDAVAVPMVIEPASPDTAPTAAEVASSDAAAAPLDTDSSSLDAVAAPSPTEASSPEVEPASPDAAAVPTAAEVASPDAAIATETEPTAPEAAAAPTGAGPVSPDAAAASPEVEAVVGARESAPTAPSMVDAPVEAPAPAAQAAVSSRALDPGDARPLRQALAAFAAVDPVAAGQLMIELLPAQGVVLDGSGEGLSYDLTIDGVGTFGVIVGAGRVEVADLPSPRPRADASFHLKGSPLTFAQVLAGETVKVGRFAGKLRASGRRRELWPLHALPSSALSLAEAVQAGARPSPGPAYGVLAHAIDPAWTRGHVFTVAQVVAGRDATTVYVSARDGQRLGVSLSAPPHDVAARVEMTRETFDLLLAGESPPHGARPTVRGDRDAVAQLKSWTDRALRAGE